MITEGALGAAVATSEQVGAGGRVLGGVVLAVPGGVHSGARGDGRGP